MAKNTDKSAALTQRKHGQEINHLHGIARIYVWVILALYPLYVGFDGYDDIIHSKALVFWSAAIIFFIVFSLFYLAYWLGLRKEDRPAIFFKTFSIPDWAALVFLAVVTVSYLLSRYKDMAFWGQTNRNDGFLTYFCMIMSYFILSRWYKPRQTDFAVFSISSILVCIIGFLQFHGIDFMNLFPYNRNSYTDGNGNPLYSGYSISFRSTIGNIDFVSAYVCITIIIFGILYVKTKGPLRFLYLAASVMNFDLMVICGADSGKTGVLGAMILLIPYWLSERKSLGRVLTLLASWGFMYALHHHIMINNIMPGWSDMAPRYDLALKNNYSTLPLNIIFIISLVSLIAGLVLILPKRQAWLKIKTAQIAGICLLAAVLISGVAVVEVAGQGLPERNIIYQAREILHGRMHDSFGSGRGFLWRNSLEQFSANPSLFGTGSDTFIHAFGNANQAEAKSQIGVMFDKAHNDFLQILLCNGILALIAYLALIAGSVVLSVKKSFNDDILLVVFGGVTAYLIQSFFGIDTLTVTPVYWIILAILRQRQADL